MDLTFDLFVSIIKPKAKKRTDNNGEDRIVTNATDNIIVKMTENSKRKFIFSYLTHSI